MSSQPPSSGNMDVTDTDYGTSAETFLSDSASLWLMDYGHEYEARMVSQGLFSCTILTSHLNPIFTVSCKVGTIAWPVTKDAPVLQVGQRRFMFAVPGLAYGFQLPQDCSEETLHQVVRFLRYHARYEDKREIEMAISGNDEAFWIAAKQETQQLLLDRLAEYDYHPPSQTVARARECSRIIRLGRLSTVTQTINEGMLAGSIEPVNIELHNFLSEHYYGRSFPTIFMYQTMVDAIELRRLLSDEEYASVGQDEAVPADDLNFAVWSLRRNKMYDLATTLSRFELRTLDRNQGNGSDIDGENGLDDDEEEDEEDDDEGSDDDDDGGEGSDDEGLYDDFGFQENGDVIDDDSNGGSSDDDDDDGDDDDVNGFPYY